VIKHKKFDPEHMTAATLLIEGTPEEIKAQEKIIYTIAAKYGGLKVCFFVVSVCCVVVLLCCCVVVLCCCVVLCCASSLSSLSREPMCRRERRMESVGIS